MEGWRKVIFERLEVRAWRIFPSGFRRLIGNCFGRSLRLDRSQAGVAIGVLAMLEIVLPVVTVRRSLLALAIMLMPVICIRMRVRSGTVRVAGLETFDDAKLDNEKEPAELKAEQNHHTQGDCPAMRAVASFASKPHKRLRISLDAVSPLRLQVFIEKCQSLLKFGVLDPELG